MLNLAVTVQPVKYIELFSLPYPLLILLQLYRIALTLVASRSRRKAFGSYTLSCIAGSGSERDFLN